MCSKRLSHCSVHKPGAGIGIFVVSSRPHIPKAYTPAPPKMISERVIASQVLMEVAGESLEQLAGSAAPRQRVQPVAAATEMEPDEDEALQARLDAVRS